MRRFNLSTILNAKAMFKIFCSDKVNSGKIVSLSVTAMIACLLLFCACNDDSKSTSTDDDSAPIVVAEEVAVSPMAIDTFAAIDADVASVTPRVDFTAANPNLEDWADWRDVSDDDPEDPMTQNAVLEKLLSDSAESIFAPVQFLGDLMYVIQIIDDIDSTIWDEAGSTTVSGTDPETGESGEIPLTVSLVEDAVTLPTFFQDKVPEDIQITMASSINRIISFDFVDDTTGWQTVVALGEDDDYYYLMASAAHETLNETQTFVAYMDRVTETMTLFYASVDDDQGFGVYTRWAGNTAENWFSISQTKLGEEVVGGGTIEGDGAAAFKSRKTEGNTGDAIDVYYLVDLTVANIEDGTDPGTSPVLGEPETGTGSVEYIIEGNTKCLGWIGQDESPVNRAELAWSPIQ